MPTKSKNAREESDDATLARAVENSLGSLSVTTAPVMIVGVSRRANVGNFEHIDIYSGVAIPITGKSIEDMEGLSAAIQDAAEFGFRETSRETFDRYKLIKDSANPRKEDPPKQ